MKALALISGGLDSALAAKLIQNQGIEVVGLYFEIPFCACRKEMLSQLGIEIKYIDIKAEFLRLLENPRYGFGANMNPCIDCKIFMFQKARALLAALDAKFIISGEVLGQRPMSQNRPALELIAKRAEAEGILLRPLSAKLLARTLPEKEGWVRQEALLGFSGRSRRPQIALAKELKLNDYPNPSGGCLLTDPAFARRLKELLGHQELSMENIELLKLGRHFRLGPRTKLIVGRQEQENAKLANLAREGDYLFYPNEELAGPTALGRGAFNEELIRLASQITCRYCDLNGTAAAEIIYKRFSEKETRLASISPAKEGDLKALRI